MPSGKLLLGHRDHILGRKFMKALRLAHPELNLTSREVNEIIRESNKEIANIVINEQAGFKLPENLGYLVITCYKSTKKSIDMFNSNKFKKTIYHLNLHNIDKRISIRWIVSSKFFYFSRIYKFKACRTFSRSSSKAFKQGANFLNWSKKDFMKFDKIYKAQELRNKSKWE